jgi:hypothetical protein
MYSEFKMVRKNYAFALCGIFKTVKRSLYVPYSEHVMREPYLEIILWIQPSALLNCLKHHKTIFFFAKFIDIRKIW